MTNSMKTSTTLGMLVFGGAAGIAAMSADVWAGSVTTPTVTAPTVTTPSVTAPKVTAPTVTAPTVNTPSVPTTGTLTCGSELKVVKAALKKAPAGAGKDLAKTHYDNAATANKSHDDKTCLSELDAASAALK